MEWTERMELEDLDRRLRHLPSTEEAEAKLDELQAAVEAEAKEIEAKIKQCRKALKTPDLTGLEHTHVAQKAQELDDQLQEFRQRSDMRLRFARGLVETCREWNPMRERYEELKQRANAVEKALALQV
jgi:Skp family chaperone for outer membrane proteins